MKNLIKKNKFLRAQFKKTELDSYLNPRQSDKKYGLTKIRNICVNTGRSRAINLEYKLSRLEIKKLAELGGLIGWHKV
jgi:ribosomal protein S14